VLEGHPSNIYFGLNPIWVSTALLAITYAVIISEKINRSIVALVGAALMVVVGVLDQEEAVAGTVAGIGERNGVSFSFVTFTLHAFPMMLVSIVIAHLYVWWRYF
jgi:Na+/H+ antiporter NhaD/arsenite permease-like protein